MHTSRSALGLLALFVLTSCGSGSIDVSALKSSPNVPSSSAPSASFPPPTSSSSVSSAPSSRSSSPPSSAPPSAPSSSPASPKTNATATLNRAGLRPGDLPVQWDAEPSNRSDVRNDAAEQTDLRVCAGLADNSGKKQNQVESSDYSSDPFDVFSLTTRYLSAADNDIRTLLARPRFEQCFALLVRRGYVGSAPVGAVVGKVTSSLTRGSGGGSRAVAASITTRTPVDDHGDRFSFYDTVVYLTGTTVESELYFSGQGRPVPGVVRKRLVALVAARTARA